MDGSALLGSNVVTGVLNLNSGSLVASVIIASNAVLNWKDGLVGAAAALTVQSNGVANLLTGGAKYLDGPMTNSGAVLWTGGTIYVRNNNSGNLGRAVNRGLWQMQGNLDLAQWFSNGLEIFNNSGTIRKTSGTGAGSISITFQNQFGNLEVLSGGLRLDRGQQLDGLFVAGFGAVESLNDPTVKVTSTLMSNWEIASPSFNSNGVTDNVAVVSWPSGAKPFHVSVTCFQINCDLLGVR